MEAITVPTKIDIPLTVQFKIPGLLQAHQVGHGFRMIFVPVFANAKWMSAGGH
jgi:peptidoglycan biosynthesis protein MviN/MurJ (putative lipid II flippase)